MTGEPGRPGVRVGSSLIDQGTGTWAALGVLAALLERERTGEGTRRRRLPLRDGDRLHRLPPRRLPRRRHRPRRARARASRWSRRTRCSRTRDGELLVAGGNDRLFRAICEVLDLPELVDDPRFATNADRVAKPRRARDLLEERLRDRRHGRLARATHARRASRLLPSPTRATSRSHRRPRRSASSSGSTTPGSPTSRSPRCRCRSTASERSTGARRRTSASTRPRCSARRATRDEEIAALAELDRRHAAVGDAGGRGRRPALPAGRPVATAMPTPLKEGARGEPWGPPRRYS